MPGRDLTAAERERATRLAREYLARRAAGKPITNRLLPLGQIFARQSGGHVPSVDEVVVFAQRLCAEDTGA